MSESYKKTYNHLSNFKFNSLGIENDSLIIVKELNEENNSLKDSSTSSQTPDILKKIKITNSESIKSQSNSNCDINGIQTVIDINKILNSKNISDKNPETGKAMLTTKMKEISSNIIYEEEKNKVKIEENLEKEKETINDLNSLNSKHNPFMGNNIFQQYQQQFLHQQQQNSQQSNPQQLNPQQLNHQQLNPQQFMNQHQFMNQQLNPQQFINQQHFYYMLYNMYNQNNVYAQMEKSKMLNNLIGSQAYLNFKNQQNNNKQNQSNQQNPELNSQSNPQLNPQLNSILIPQINQQQINTQKEKVSQIIEVKKEKK